MNVICKSAIGEEKAKLLFLMGATWFNSSMFDLKTETDSFSTLLNNQGITTYTFDNIGSNFGDVRDYVGDRHEENKQCAVDIVNNYDIDFVMGYSYGCYAAKHVAQMCDIKGVIFLDPRSNVKSSKKQINGGDRFLLTRNIIKNDIAMNGATLSEFVLNDHLNSLTDQNTFTGPGYPVNSAIEDKKSFCDEKSIKKLKEKTRVMAIFTKNSTEYVRSFFTEKSTKYYQDASHWIMIEHQKENLSQDVFEFIDKYINI